MSVRLLETVRGKREFISCYSRQTAGFFVKIPCTNEHPILNLLGLSDIIQKTNKHFMQKVFVVLLHFCFTIMSICFITHFVRQLIHIILHVVIPFSNSYCIPKRLETKQQLLIECIQIRGVASKQLVQDLVITSPASFSSFQVIINQLQFSRLIISFQKIFDGINFIIYFKLLSNEPQLLKYVPLK